MVITVNVPAVPTVNVVLSALVIVGALAAATVSVKVWVASGATPLAAVIVSVVDAAGARVRRARERGGAVAVVHERHARGQSRRSR